MSADVPKSRSRRRVTIVTAGHLSTCPRMLKAADALAEIGHDVRVVSVNATSWAAAADEATQRARTWKWSPVQYGRMVTAARQRTAGAIAGIAGPYRAPIAVVMRAFSRVHDELVDAITAQPADLVYGGTTGALGAVVEAARCMKVPCGVDFEDLHSAEHEGSDVRNALAARIERHVIERARFLTTSSPMIADEYVKRYGVRPLTIHNTFSITPPREAGGVSGGPLRLYWFSQTLGPGRGLEEVVRAGGAADVAVELHLRARPIPEYLESLRRLQAATAPRLSIVVHEPGAPDDMVSLAQPYDAGLACEEPHVLNRRICLTNKVFTYLASGIPALLSRTPAQARLEPELGEAAFGYGCGDVPQLARIIRRLADDPSLRCRARAAARDVAARRWHWEHPDDRGALIAAVDEALT